MQTASVVIFNKHPLDCLRVTSSKLRACKSAFSPSPNIELEDYIRKVRKTYWADDAVDFDHDQRAFDALTAEQKSVITRVVMFFAIAEGPVIENVANMESRILCENVAEFLSSQETAEKIHARTYFRQLQGLFMTNDETNALLCTITGALPIINKNSWMKEHFGNPPDRERSLIELLFASIAAEGILFQSSFTIINELSKSKFQMSGVLKTNSYISRDEALHCEFYLFLLRQFIHSTTDMNRQVAGEIGIRIFESAARVEKEFVNDIFTLTDSFFGLTKEGMLGYVDHIMASLWNKCELWKLKVPINPLENMDYYSAVALNNNFENAPTNYIHGVSANHASIMDILNRGS